MSLIARSEENPSVEEAVVVAARSTQSSIVVNLPSLWAEVAERDRLILEPTAEPLP